MAERDPDLELDEDLQDEEGQEGQGNEGDEGSGSAEGAADVPEEGSDGEESTEGSVREEPRQLSRGERRFQKLTNDLRESNDRYSRLERELQQERQERQARERREQQKEPTAEEMALWTTDQIVDYKLGKATGQFNATLAQVQMQSQDAADRTAFSSLCASDARAKKYAGEVETRLADLRKQGQNVPRENLYYYILGEKLAKQGGQAVRRQRAQGQENIRRQQGGGSTPRSDQGGGGRQAKTEAEKRRERLENVTF